MIDDCFIMPSSHFGKGCDSNLLKIKMLGYQNVILYGYYN